MRRVLLTAALALALGCESEPAASDAAVSDAGAADAGGDAGDLPVDAGDLLDAGPLADAGSDAGPIGSAGCAGGAGLSEGEHTFMLEARERRYILRLPSGYSGARAWPVVMALHGNGGSAAEWDDDRTMRAVVEDEAVFVVAEAIGGDWRDYDVDSSMWPERVESELLYFETILSELRAALCIDEDAIFSMGFSGGGSFSGVLACRRTDIRAIAVGGSVLYFEPDECVGSAAAWVSISEGDLGEGRAGYRDYFRDRAGCAAASMATTPSGCVAYDDCSADTPVHYCAYPGGHQWPDFGEQAAWDFFVRFTR